MFTIVPEQVKNSDAQRPVLCTLLSTIVCVLGPSSAQPRKTPAVGVRSKASVFGDPNAGVAGYGNEMRYFPVKGGR